MSDDLTLLEKYKPLTYISKKEKYDLVNATDYFKNNKINYDSSILCYVKEVSSNITNLYYFYCFEKDGGKDILGVFQDVDAHKDDIECLVVELTNNKMTGVCYMPHSSKEHFWIKNSNDLTKIVNNSTHPYAYIANDKHSLYPICGPIHRFLFFGDDNCSNPIVKKTNLIMIDENDYLYKTNSIGEGMVGFGRRIKKATTSIDVIRLKDLRFKELFGFL